MHRFSRLRITQQLSIHSSYQFSRPTVHRPVRSFHLSSQLGNLASTMSESTLTDEVSSVLPHEEDKYDGVIINAAALPDNDTLFTSQLTHSLHHWKSLHKRGIWLTIPLARASFVPIAASHGFHFHHAERDHVMMTHWLADSENRLPPNASHQVGVGSIVIHGSKVLLVQERSGPLRGKGVWKMPTGLVEAGEDIAVAAEREVLEETGIVATFEKMLCFRQAHQAPFGKSDLFFVCVLKPSTVEIKMQEAELVGCEWHDPQVLFDQSFFKKSPLYGTIHDLVMKEIEVQLGNLEPQPSIVHSKLTVGFRPGKQSLYYFDSSLTQPPEGF
jgi:ADP-ribose pyrophosphatase YjhB (NUDIX family)